ncbi:MAG: YceI family protein [Schleiferiaceae bacterium]|nr:YceI family protein [Schleiferiaceae bacterium]
MAGSIAFAMTACNSGETVEATDAVDVQEVSAEAVTYSFGSDQALTWEGHKPFVENYGHYGTIKIAEGSLMVKEGAIEGGSFVIDMNTIIAEDMIGNENYDKLVGHLNSDDFFAVEQFPTSKFEITNVVAETDEEKGTTHKISGNLTLRDQTKNITFGANVMMTENSVTLSAPGFKIDRKNWNVMFGSTGIEGLAKDKLIADDIALKFEISATKS